MSRAAAYFGEPALELLMAGLCHSFLSLAGRSSAVPAVFIATQAVDKTSAFGWEENFCWGRSAAAEWHGMCYQY